MLRLRNAVDSDCLACEHAFVSVPAPKPTVPRAGRPAMDTDPILRVCPRHGLTPHGRHRTGEDTFRIRCKSRPLAEAGGCCALCGYARCIMNLHFHHVDPTQKSLEMNMGKGKSLG